ncbi:general negative regulator of transcription subunit 5 [Mortierella sp. NVP85]|nr:general negative regulator of transcription subunit 5 [Mortierella sp. NVP85]
MAKRKSYRKGPEFRKVSKGREVAKKCQMVVTFSDGNVMLVARVYTASMLIRGASQQSAEGLQGGSRAALRRFREKAEIDKVLKKVSEGVEMFEEILEKIETTTNANQKDKYETDLKKEIKKLQRLRDQIKTWLSSNDIKDKRALLENRKLIEHQMERFKAIEKEMKTKAYSREGLIMFGRMDPKEKEKAETCTWVTERVEALSIQIEGMEAEMETLQSKKGKSSTVKERISELEERIERHQWHQGRLELILRLLENGQIETDKVMTAYMFGPRPIPLQNAASNLKRSIRLDSQIIALKEDVNYYVDQNSEPDFEEMDIYTELNLSDEEDTFAVGAEDYSNHKDDEQPEKTKEELEPPKKHSKEADLEPTPSPTPTPAKITLTKPASTKKPPTTSESKETKPAPAPSPVVSKSVLNGPAGRQPAVPRVGLEKSPVIQYATAAAANLLADSPRTATVSISPRVTAAPPIKDSPKPASAVLTKADTPSPKVAHGRAVVSPTATPTLTTTPAQVQTQDNAQASLSTAVSSFSAPDDTKAEPLNEPFKVPVEMSPIQPTRIQTPPVVAEKESVTVEAASPQQQSGPEQEIRLPAALADLAHSFEASKERAMSKDVGFFVHQMLEASYQFIPEAVDTERPKHYQPKNPYPTPSYYPQAPLPGLFDNAAMFEKFDIDTLFFIFYYQQGTYQQYLAARELKKQSWRFHKKYLTWFQRHEEPKAITDDYEQGTYIYFDYEGAWCQRKKTDFRFEYKFLEDAELV